MRQCPKCLMKYSDSESFCMKCGVKLIDIANNSASQENSYGMTGNANNMNFQCACCGNNGNMPNKLHIRYYKNNRAKNPVSFETLLCGACLKNLELVERGSLNHKKMISKKTNDNLKDYISFVSKRRHRSGGIVLDYVYSEPNYVLNGWFRFLINFGIISHLLFFIGITKAHSPVAEAIAFLILFIVYAFIALHIKIIWDEYRINRLKTAFHFFTVALISFGLIDQLFNFLMYSYKD